MFSGETVSRKHGPVPFRVLLTGDAEGRPARPHAVRPGPRPGRCRRTGRWRRARCNSRRRSAAAGRTFARDWRRRGSCSNGLSSAPRWPGRVTIWAMLSTAPLVPAHERLQTLVGPGEFAATLAGQAASGRAVGPCCRRGTARSADRAPAGPAADSSAAACRPGPARSSTAGALQGQQRMRRRRRAGRLVATHATAPFARLQIGHAAHALHGPAVGIDRLEVQRLAGRARK